MLGSCSHGSCTSLSLLTFCLHCSWLRVITTRVIPEPLPHPDGSAMPGCGWGGSSTFIWLFPQHLTFLPLLPAKDSDLQP